MEKEACEFLKFIKHRKYNIVEQLNKLIIRISMLSLLQNSELYHNALMKALNKAYVEGINQLVGNIMKDAFIAFSDEEIPPKGRGVQRLYTLPSSARIISCPELF